MKQQRTHSDKRFYNVLQVIVVLLSAWAIWLQIMPHPLGDKLEYVGKEDYGSWLPLSSTRPASIYYYATDMTPEEVEAYFRKAKPHHPIDHSQWATRIWLKHGEDFLLIKYYTPEDIRQHDNIPKLNDSRSVVGIASEQYDVARRALK